LAELSAVARTLAQSRRRFVVRFAGVESFESPPPGSLPINVEVLDPSAFAADGFWYHGRRLAYPRKPAIAAQAAKKPELAPTEAAVIRVLNFVRRNEDVNLIGQAVKQDPGLLHGLLRYINSARIAFNTVHRGFQNIEQAIMFMGYRHFSKWLSLYLLHASVEASMPAPYLASIVRARMMEVLAKPAGFSEKEQDRIFITGVFSLLDEITGVSMEAILQSLELDAPVREALLERKGVYAPLLKLADVSENGAVEELSGHIAEVGLSVRDVNLALLKAIQFASDFD
jgi:EAL and modified HD-GYP domain-containing signal transduction protein